ncbi:MAG: hypothetical protein KJ630_09040 [Proteobacteria bacterium]|nr:hypothetical protein [Pseudomonadota bacterium]
MVKTKYNISLGTVVLRSSALIGSKAVQDVFLSLLFIWLARINQSGYGLIVLGLSVAMLLRSVLSMGLDQYTLRELSSSLAHTGTLLRKMARVKILISGVALFSFLVFALLKQWPLQQIIIIFILLFSQCFEGIADTFFNLFRAEGQSINESVCRTGPNVIASLYGAGCLFFHLDIFFFSLMFFLSSSLKLGAAILGASKLCVFLRQKKTGFLFNKTEIRSLIFISAISFFSSFYNEIQMFWLKQFHAFSDIAHYRVAHDVTAFICGVVAQLIIGAVLFPQLVSTFSVKNNVEFQNIVQSYFKKIITLGGGVAFFLSLFGGKCVLLIYGNQYLSAEPLVPLFGVAALFSFINNFIIYVLLAMREEKQMCFFLLIPVSISILLGPLLIAGTGPMGAASSLLLSRVMLSIILITALQRKIHFLRLSEYSNVALCWLVAATVFVLLVQINYFLSGTLAISIYFLLIWFEMRIKEKRLEKAKVFNANNKQINSH